MRKLLPVGLLVLTAALAASPPLRAELTDAQKRQLFLQSREDIRPVPRASVTPRPKPTPAPRTTPRPKPKPTPVEEPEETPTPRPKVRPTPAPEEEKPTPRPKPTPRVTPTPEPAETPPPPRNTPRPVPASTPPPRPAATPVEHTAPIVVEKSGKADDEGFAPPPPKKRGLFGLFGGGPKYAYLTPGVRSAIDGARVKKGRWKYIVVHNSGTRQGNAKAFDSYHRNVRKMQNGMAYHFVIGNGRSSGDGEIEIGSRWTRQINGGHVASDYLNNIALGICLVGDFNRDLPTKAQTAALGELISYLRKRCGRVQGRDIIVRAHRQINPKPTDCPGTRFPVKWLNREFHD